MLAARGGAIAVRPLARWGKAGCQAPLLARRAPCRPFGPLVPGDQSRTLRTLPLLPPGATPRRSSGGGGRAGGSGNSAGGSVGGSGRATPPAAAQEQQPQPQPQPQQLNLDSNDDDDDHDDDPVAYWGYWGDGQASSAVAAAEAAAEAAAAAAAAAEAAAEASGPSALSPAAAACLFSALTPSAMFETAFFAADRDGDGRLTREEAARLLAYATATSGEGAREAARAARRRAREAQAAAEEEARKQAAVEATAQAASPTPQQHHQPRTWDEHLVADWRRASLAARGGVPAAALRFAARALSGKAHERDGDDESQGPPAPPPSRPAPLPSDILWSALFAGVAVAALGAFAAAAPSLPLVGAWHQQAAASSSSPSLPLLLSSFGALCVLLFARPESDAVRVWPVVAGQLAGTALAIACLTLLGTGLWARAVGMAAVVGFMLWADCAHPPGGALALFAMDHAPALFKAVGAGPAAAAGAGWAFCLWPSLALTLGVLMPLGWLCNHMKRTARFGWPAGGAVVSAAEPAEVRAASPLPPGPLPPAPPLVPPPVATTTYDPAPLRRRYHVRTSDGGGWIEDMT